MDDCKHDNDFDEYFGKCVDCGATRQQVLKAEFTNELQDVYEKMLESMGIAGGYLDKGEYPEVFNAQDEFSDIVSNWLDNLYETVE